MDFKKLQKKLFDTEKNVYSVIDGAVLPALLGKLEEHEGESTCLFRGELPFDLAEAAPYLVKLNKDDAFTQWLLKESLESTCCIFAYSDKEFIKLRKHFRSFMKIEDPDGKRLLFRFYDPCVLRAFLPICTPENNNMMFAKVDTYLMLSEKYDELLSFKKPTLKQNKIDYKENIKAALALKNIEIEDSEVDAEQQDFDEEKTVIMKIKPKPAKVENKIEPKKVDAEQQDFDEEKTVLMKIKPKPAKVENKIEPKEADMKITSADEEIDPDKTVLMVRKPKK